MLRNDPWAERNGRLPASSALDLSRQVRVDPDLVRYVQTQTIEVALNELHAIDTGLEDRIYVAGDQAVHAFSAEGRPERVIPLEGRPSCLAAAGEDHVHPGRLYVGMGARVALFDASGSPIDVWDGLAEKTLTTSIGLSANEVFVADAGNRVVLRLDPDGKLLGRIGQPDPDRQMPGFILPSPYFDLAPGPDGLLYVANPARGGSRSMRLDGSLQTYWGKGGSAIGDFFGCCNPAHFSLLPDGRFVTSEKGIPRVKVYTPDGELECVVATPEQLAVSTTRLGDPRLRQGQTVYDVAVDGRNRVLVLDPWVHAVRVFQPRADLLGAQP